MPSAQEVLMGTRVAHMRELKAEIACLREANAALREEAESLKAHFDLALLAAMDLRGQSALEIWDGWNLILGANKAAKDRADLVAQAKASGNRVWIVLDGHDENVAHDGNVRISYTGGSGAHRADKLICDFVRMARYLGLAGNVSVRTNDKDFRKTVQRLGAAVISDAAAK